MRVILVAPLLLGCGRSSTTAPQPEAEPAPDAATVTLSLDGVAAATYAVADLATRRRISDAFPDHANDPVHWTVLHGVAPQRELMVPEFGHRYAAHDVYLYLDDGVPTVGVFRRARADQPAHVQQALATAELSLAGVASISVWTDTSDSPDSAGVATPPTGLTITIDGAAVELSAERLGTLALREASGAVARKRTGWGLADVLALAGVTTPPRSLVATGGTEETVTLDAAALADPGQHAILRRDRHAELRLAVWHDRDPAYVAQVHQLTTLAITTK